MNFSTESYDGGLAKLSAMEQAKNTTWDLIDLETNDAITACDEGLLQKFDKKSLGKTSDFIPGSISDCAVASMVWSTVYAYDTSKLKTAADHRQRLLRPAEIPRQARPAQVAEGNDGMGADRGRRRPEGCLQGARHAGRRRSRVQEARHDQAEHRVVGGWRAGAAIARGRRGRDDAGLQRPHRRRRARRTTSPSRPSGTRRCTTSNGGAFRRARSTPTRPRNSSSPLRSRRRTRT